MQITPQSPLATVSGLDCRPLALSVLVLHPYSSLYLSTEEAHAEEVAEAVHEVEQDITDTTMNMDADCQAEHRSYSDLTYLYWLLLP